MELSTRLISAYNEIDDLLHEMADLRPQVPFTEAVRIASMHSAVVNRYSDDLFAYGRLRNAIVHSAKGDRVIAEPHLEVVEDMENILRQIKKPLPAKEVLGKRKVISIRSDSPVTDAVRLISSYRYSNIPVIEDGRVLGILTPKDIVLAIGIKLATGEDVDGLLKNSKVKDIARNAKFCIVDHDVTAIDAIQAFEDPKLRALILTTTGNSHGQVMDIITSGDLITLNSAVLD